MNYPPEIPPDAGIQEGEEVAVSHLQLPMPEWHKEELDRREQLGELPGIPWAEVKRQILKRPKH